MLMLLLLLCLIGTAFGLLRWRRCQWTFYGVAFALLFAAGCGPLPMLLLRWLQAPYDTLPSLTWAQRNAIVLLGAGTVRVNGTAEVKPTLFAHGRIIEAYALYRACKQGGNDCKIVISGGDAFRNGMPEAASYAAVLASMGVSGGDLLQESRSMNTWQNAQFVRPILQDYRPGLVLLVSSAAHLDRAVLYFEHFGMDVTPVRGDYVDVRMTWWPNATNVSLTDLAMHEYIGRLSYHVYNLMGWNAPPSRYGAP